MEPLSLANHSQMVQYYLHYNLQIPSLFILKSREEEFTNSSLGGLATSHSLLINEILSLETLTFLLFTFVNVLHLSSCIFFFFFEAIWIYLKWQPTPCLENPRGRGAWWAAVYGVAQSWTWLKWLSSSSSSTYCISKNSGDLSNWLDMSKIIWDTSDTYH